MIERVVSTERDTHGTKRTGACLRHLQAGNLTVHLLEPVAGNTFREFFVVKFRNGVA